LAQTSAPLMRGSAGAVRPTASVAVKPVFPTQGTGEDMRVELALLANPATFAYPLSAIYTSEGLELHGFVPNMRVKNLALDIAKKTCTVPLVDKLQLHPTLTVRAPEGPAGELEAGAKALLVESFGDAATRWQIKAAELGQVVLNGSCNS